MLQSPPFAHRSCPVCIIGCFSHHLFPLDPILVEPLDASVNTFYPWILSRLHHQMLQSPPFALGSCPGCVTECFSHHLLPLDPVLVESLDASVTTFCPWILSWFSHWMLQSPPFALGSYPGCITGCFSHHLFPLDPILVESLDASSHHLLPMDPVLVELLDASVTTFSPWILSWLSHWMLQSPPFAHGSCPG